MLNYFFLNLLTAVLEINYKIIQTKTRNINYFVCTDFSKFSIYVQNKLCSVGLIYFTSTINFDSNFCYCKNKNFEGKYFFRTLQINKIMSAIKLQI